MDNDSIEGFGDLGNPAFLLLGAVSLVVVLTFLHGGGWRLLTDFALGVASYLYGLAMSLALFSAPALYLMAVFGAPEARAARLVWALVVSAWFIVSAAVFYTDNRLTRFADSLRIR